MTRAQARLYEQTVLTRIAMATAADRERYRSNPLGCLGECLHRVGVSLAAAAEYEATVRITDGWRDSAVSVLMEEA